MGLNCDVHCFKRFEKKGATFRSDKQRLSKVISLSFFVKGNLEECQSSRRKLNGANCKKGKLETSRPS